MQKIILLLVLSFSQTFVLLGQEVQMAKDTLHVSGPNSTGDFDFADIYAQFIFYNSSSDNDSFRWKRKLNILPSNKWTSSLCDIYSCHWSGVDSSDIIIKKGDSGIFYAHFYPNDGIGTAIMEIEIYNILNPEIKASVYITATVWDAKNSLNTLVLEQDIFFPNPIKDGVLHFKNNFSYIEIYDLYGKKVLGKEIEFNDRSIEILYLDKGLYSVFATENDKTRIQKIIVE